MRKSTFIGLNVVCVVLIAIISVIAYAWYAGVLADFIKLHHSFGSSPSIPLIIHGIFAKFAWLIPVIHVVLYLCLLVIPKSRNWLKGFVLVLVIQIILMLMVMYGSLIRL